MLRRIGLAGLFWGVLFVFVFGAGGSLFGQPVEYHGADSVFQDNGITILWAILKGKNEDASTVYVRIVKTGPASEDLKSFSVIARDVLSGDEETVISDKVLNVVNTIVETRGSFSDKAQRRFVFYEGRKAGQTTRPSVEVYYYAIPDTAPEFLTSTALETYLEDTLARLRTAR